jgi:alanine racemase
MDSESPDLARAKELLEQAAAAGFRFQQLSADSALVGTRETELWVDHVRIDGVEYGCSAHRMIRGTRLELAPIATVTGSAVEVLTAVLHWK